MRVPVFPAQAGVFLSASSAAALKSRLPRASGGVSETGFLVSPLEPSSPRKRGCFSRCFAFGLRSEVFPAQAGVFLRRSFWAFPTKCLPRASGGVSAIGCQVTLRRWSSPRKRGCFRACRPYCLSRSRLPRASGGVSQRVREGGKDDDGLPRASGGVSVHIVHKKDNRRSSPRKRGCFQGVRPVPDRYGVFPAQAGVFPLYLFSLYCWQCLPRARGGVSASRARKSRIAESSPRKRGCFLVGCRLPGSIESSPRKRGCFRYRLEGRSASRVFPAQAGVFLLPKDGVRRAEGLPRASGGVSSLPATW